MFPHKSCIAFYVNLQYCHSTLLLKVHFENRSGLKISTKHVISGLSGGLGRLKEVFKMIPCLFQPQKKKKKWKVNTFFLFGQGASMTKPWLGAVYLILHMALSNNGLCRVTQFSRMRSLALEIDEIILTYIWPNPGLPDILWDNWPNLAFGMVEKCQMQLHWHLLYIPIA